MLITPSAKSAAIQRPAAADAPGAVARLHLQRSRETAAPGADEEPSGVEGGGEEGCADGPASCRVPGEIIAENVAPEVRDPEGEEACAAPGEQIAGGGDERRERYS